MDLSQQVKNFQATVRQSRTKQPRLKSENTSQMSHDKALQALSDGYEVPYDATLRVVIQEGSRGPKQSPAKTQKPPGFIRNESGGLFTS